MMHNPTVLLDILETSRKGKAQGESSLLVFDLDSTLLDVSGRHHAVLRNFAQLKDIQHRFPQLLSKVEKLKITRHQWGIKDALMSAGVTSPPFLLEEGYKYWSHSFFHNDYLVYDTPMMGAIEYTQNISQYADVVYLTGRDVERLGKGTIEQLKRHNFPLQKDLSNLFLKPHKSMVDANYKLDFFKNLLNQNKYEKIWFFDNDPRNLNLIVEHVPEIHCVFFKSAHPPGITPPSSIPHIHHFQIGT